MFPRGIYPCLDGYIYIHVTNEWWPRLAQMLEWPDLLTDPRFATSAARMHADHQGEFEAIFIPWLLERTKQEIMERAQAAQVLATAVNTPEDVLRDRHFRAREFFVEVPHPDAGDGQAAGPALPYGRNALAHSAVCAAPGTAQRGDVRWAAGVEPGRVGGVAGTRSHLEDKC